jgi:hypothetical protein
MVTASHIRHETGCPIEDSEQDGAGLLPLLFISPFLYEQENHVQQKTAHFFQGFPKKSDHVFTHYTNRRLML